MSNISYSLLGHKDRSFDVKYSSSSSLILSASEDGTAKLWDVKSKQTLHTFTHNTKNEVLRVVFIPTLPITSYNDLDNNICTCGSDGKAIIWKKINNNDESLQNDKGEIIYGKNIQDRKKNNNALKYEKSITFDHGDTQIYGCEVFNSEGNHLITAAENELFLWDIEKGVRNSSWGFGKLISTTHDGGDDKIFGGTNRNPDDTVYLFDAKISPKDDNIVAVALSDGSIRLLDLRIKGILLNFFFLYISFLIIIFFFNYIEESSSCIPQQHISVSNVNPTSISWKNTADSLIIALGSGEVAVVDTRYNGSVRKTIKSHNRPCYGVSFYNFPSKSNLDNNHFISWSSDSTVKLWNIDDDLDSPICNKTIPNFPVFSCDIDKDGNIACAGGLGGDSKSFIGTPLHVISPFL
jgi:WD40 repeat protein